MREGESLWPRFATLSPPPPTHPSRIPLFSPNTPLLTPPQVLLQLLAEISPAAINPIHVLPGSTPQERESNAK